MALPLDGLWRDHKYVANEWTSISYLHYLCPVSSSLSSWSASGHGKDVPLAQVITSNYKLRSPCRYETLVQAHVNQLHNTATLCLHGKDSQARRYISIWY